MYLTFNGFTSQIPFFYGRAVFCRTWLEGTCYLLSKYSVPLIPPKAVWKPTSLSKLKILFLISSDENVLLLVLMLRPIVWLLPPPPPHPVVLLNDLHSLLRPAKLGLWSADSLTYILTVSVVSRCAVSSNTEGEGKLNLTSPLSVAYHVT